VAAEELPLLPLEAGVAVAGLWAAVVEARLWWQRWMGAVAEALRRPLMAAGTVRPPGAAEAAAQ
jgi:hypothetical protein